MTGNFEDLLADVGKFSIPPEESILLIIDDEVAIVSTLERFFARQSYVVLTAQSAEEAIDILGTDYLPHVVLTDKNLPGADGLEVIRKGKVLSPDSEFILMTGYATIESSIEALYLGAAGYIQKPFDLKKVLGQVESALEKSLALHQQRMLVERLKSIYEEQTNVTEERNVMKDFVDTKVRQLLADLGSQFQDLKSSLQTLEQFPKTIALADQDTSSGEKAVQEAEKAVQEALEGWQRAALTVDSFVEKHDCFHPDTSD